MSRKYKYITRADRRLIARSLEKEVSPPAIAERLGVTTATIYREMKRGGAVRMDTGVWLWYDADAARQDAARHADRRAHPHPRRRLDAARPSAGV